MSDKKRIEKGVLDILHREVVQNVRYTLKTATT